MAVDRGELRYLIRVEDKFTAPIRKFREELLKARSTMEFVKSTSAGFREFREDVQGATTAVRQFGRAQERSRGQARDATDEEAKAAKERQRQQREHLRGLQRAQAIENQTYRQNQALAKDLARAQAREAAAQKQATAAAKTHAAQVRSVRSEYDKTESSVNRVAFTFRRLFGILAAFTVAREIAAGFGALVVESIRFNQTLEDAQIGLAGVIAAAGEVRDSQGQVLGTAEAFAAAQKEAARQQGLLRLDALRTTATFQELLEVFQTATGPGLEAGLNLDQIRQLSVRVSQAATALGIAQNQLSEEVRSLLTGTGTQRTSRIFAVLFGSNDEIRRARESGTLFQLLSSRLEAFGNAAEATEQTFTGLNQRLRESVSVASGLAAGDLFNSLKEGIADVADLFVQVQRDAAGAIVAIEPKASTVAVLKQVFDFMEGIVSVLQEASQSIAFEDVQKALGDLLSVLEAVFVGGSAFVVGFARGIGDVLSALSTMAGLVKEIAPLLTLYIQLRVVLAAINGIAGKLVTTTLSSVAGLKNLASGFTSVKKEALTAEGATRAIAAGIGLAALSAVPIVGIIFDWNIGLEKSVKLVGLALVDAFRDVQTEARQAGSILRENLGIFEKGIRDEKGLAKTIVEDTGAIFGAFAAGVTEFVGATETAETIRKGIAKQLLADDKILEKAGIDRATREAEVRKKIKEDEAKRDAEFAKQLGDIIAEGAAGEGLEKKLNDRVKQIEDLIRKTREAANVDSGATFTGRPTPVTEEERERLALKNAELAVLRAELVLQGQIGAAEAARVSPQRQAVITAQATVQQLQQNLAILQTTNQLELQKLQRETANVRGAEAQAFAQERLNNLKATQAEKEREIALQIEAQKRALEEARLIAEGSIGEGLGRGLEQFVNDFSSSFLAGIAIVQNGLQSLASFAADALVGLFDPSYDFEAQLAQFLQGIAKQILTTIFQLLIATAVAKAFGVPLPSDPTPPPSLPGFAEGGEIPGGKAAPKIARPKNLDSRDTTPIWAQPGEYMHRLSAVKKYGLDVMEAINKGAIDPLALRQLAGLRKARAARAAVRSKVGYATGGLITPAAAQDTVRKASSEADGDQMPPIALVVGNEQSLDRLLAGGKRSMLDFVKANGPAIEATLARHRSR